MVRRGRVAWETTLFEPAETFGNRAMRAALEAAFDPLKARRDIRTLEAAVNATR
jgi:hypothetical protein